MLLFHLRPQSTQIGAASKFETELVNLLRERHEMTERGRGYIENESMTDPDEEEFMQHTSVERAVRCGCVTVAGFALLR